MSLGENISKKRKEKRFTQEELAEKLNVSRQAISDWERDVQKPELQNLIDLSKLLGASLDELLEDELSGKQLSNENTSTESKTLKIVPALQIFADALKSVTSDIYITDEEEDK